MAAISGCVFVSVRGVTTMMREGVGWGGGVDENAPVCSSAVVGHTFLRQTTAWRAVG